MGWFRRWFSADYRAAVSAEAAGDMDLAAQRYALAGDHEAAARMHLVRAQRTDGHADEIEALRDAVHWAPDDGEVWRPARAALGRALLARARAEGIATERDRRRVAEAARLLGQAGEWQEAGEAWELIGDDGEAANAYSQGGLVERLELALARDAKRTGGERALREAYADYQLNLRSGDRDAARDQLVRCVEVADNKSEYRRLLDDLESRLITGGCLTLAPRGRPAVVVCARPQLVMGRDPLCELVLRSPDVSRQHARIDRAAGEHLFELRDLDSKNGTLIGGLPISGGVPLVDRGSFALGEVYQFDFRVTAEPPTLRVEVTKGMDSGLIALLAQDGAPIALAEVELGGVIRFERGRPLLVSGTGESGLQLNGEPLPQGRSQLIRGDVLTLAGVDIEVQ